LEIENLEDSAHILNFSGGIAIKEISLFSKDFKDALDLVAIDVTIDLGHFNSN
jgi:hypothetical protein